MAENEEKGSIALKARNLLLAERANSLIKSRSKSISKVPSAQKGALSTLKALEFSQSQAANIDLFIPFMYNEVMVDNIYDETYFQSVQRQSSNALVTVFTNAVMGHLDLVREAVISGAFDINSQEAPAGNTLLHFLAPIASYDTIKFVLDLPGTDPTLLNDGGRSAAEIAIRSRSPREMCAMLTDAECTYDLNWRDPPELNP